MHAAHENVLLSLLDSVCLRNKTDGGIANNKKPSHSYLVHLIAIHLPEQNII